MNRGRRGDTTFADQKDHESFLTIVQESSELFGIRVAAYCLMSNHYHLLIQTPDANLSRAMRHINGVYTQRYNRRRKIDGPLFRGRYKSVLVEEDTHLLELLRCIHLNPVRAKMCRPVADYAWSSHPADLFGGKKWQWLGTRPLLAMFSPKVSVARDRYQKFIKDGDSPEVLDFFAKKNVSSLFGTDNFVAWVRKQFFADKQHNEVPQAQQLAPSVVEIKEAVCRSYGITEETLTTSIRGQVNEPRNMAIYLSRRLSRLKLEDIAKQFGLGSYSSVSSVVVRTGKLLSQDSNLAKKLKKVSNELCKGHKGQAKSR